MAKERRALLIYHAAGSDAAESVAPLNALLAEGWRLVTATAMGGAGSAEAGAHFAALVVLEREEEKTVSGFGR